MRLITRLALVILLFSAMPSGFGQVSQKKLRNRYGPPLHGSYSLRAGVSMSASDGPRDQACVLTISGQLPESELLAIFDELVPVAARGKELNSLLFSEWASGTGLQSVKDYEKVSLVYFLPGRDIVANPAAFITFKSKSCATAAREARATGFRITKRE
jgi:hypothetical protein